MRIVVLGAFSDELTYIINEFNDLEECVISKCRCLSGHWNNHDIYISLTGIGTSASAITTTILCEKLLPDLIIFCGVAGGLRADQQIGDLVIACNIIDADLLLLPAILRDTPYKTALVDPHTLTTIRTHYSVNSSIANIIETFEFNGLKQGNIVTSNIFPSPKSLFDEIRQLHCSAIEMESSGIYKAAEYYNVPVVSIRSISNLLDEHGNDLGTKSNALEICSKKLAACLIPLLAHISHNDTTHQNKSNHQIELIIQQYALSPHPEGGWYRRVFESEDCVVAQGEAAKRYKNEPRLAGTSIIYLLAQHDFSAWHSIQSDETWCFHTGDPLLLRMIDKADHLHEIILSHESGYLQFTVRAGEIFSAVSLGKFSLASCVVTPGFDFKDLKFISKDAFLTQFPQYEALSKFTRCTTPLN